MNKLKLLFNTVKFLKLIQIYFRLFYFLRIRYRKFIGFEYQFLKKSNSKKSINVISSAKENVRETRIVNITNKITKSC